MAQCLKSVAERVYHKYGQAPRNIEGDAAKKLLQFDDLKTLPESLNPLGLIKTDGTIDTQALPLKSIEEFLSRDGQAEGKKILDRFNEPEFGWSKDTTRYLIAVMFLSSMIKLRIGGEYVTVKGPQSIEKLSNATGFNQIGVSLQGGDQPNNEQKKLAAQNLTALTGVTVLPLPQKISETVLKFFPDFKDRYAGLDVRLEALGLPGADRIRSLQGGITEIIKGDASDATFRLGKPDAPLYVDLQWAKKVKDCLAHKVTENTIKELRTVQQSVKSLPAVPVIDQLKTQISGQFTVVEQILATDGFFDRIPDLKDGLRNIQQSIANACQQFEQYENTRLAEAVEAVRSRPGYAQLTDEQRDEIEQSLGKVHITGKSSIQGIQDVMREAYQFYSVLSNLRVEIDQMAAANAAAPADPAAPYPEPEPEPGVADGDRHPPIPRTVRLNHLPRKITSPGDIDRIISELQKLKSNFKDGDVVELAW
jgi:hypothetical protein